MPKDGCELQYSSVVSATASQIPFLPHFSGIPAGCVRVFRTQENRAWADQERPRSFQLVFPTNPFRSRTEFCQIPGVEVRPVDARMLIRISRG